MHKRLENSGHEMSFANQYRYINANVDFKKTVHDAELNVENLLQKYK